MARPPFSRSCCPTAFLTTRHGRLRVGRIDVDLRHLNIHSDDATVLLVPELGLLLRRRYARRHRHLCRRARRVRRPSWPTWTGCGSGTWQEFCPITAILDDRQGWLSADAHPRHAAVCPKSATLHQRTGAALCSACSDFIAGPLQAGWVSYFAPYEKVHRANVESVVATR